LGFRILVVSPDFHPSVSGYASAVTSLVRALTVYGGCSVDVLTTAPLGESGELHLGSGTVWRVGNLTGVRGTARIREVMLAARLPGLQRRRQYDFVIFETAELAVAGLWALAHFPEKVVLRVHGCAETEWTLFRRHPHWILNRMPTRSFIRRVPIIFSTTQFYLEFVRRHYLDDNTVLLSEKYTGVIPNTVWFGNEGAQLEDGLDRLLRDSVTLLTLGRADAPGMLQKNFLRLVLAVERLKGKSYFPEMRLLIVGDGPGLWRLRRLVAEVGLEKNVILLGRRPNGEVRVLQSRCSAVVLASTFEGQSMFAVEALAAGAPLLVSRGTGLAEMVEEGRNGLLFDPWSVPEIAEKIDSFVLEMLPVVERLRARSRQLFEARYAPKVVAAKMVAELRSLSAMAAVGVLRKWPERSP
jgi:glycosyltransferase involved in cell wall biosynthesis